MALRLWLPASPELDRANAVLHWLKQPGDVIGPNDVVALLGTRTELRAPKSAAVKSRSCSRPRASASPIVNLCSG
jgi:hypothetical protein